MTANPNVHPGTLECGCRRGHYLCAKATMLWQEVGRWYERRRMYPHSMVIANGYEAARAQYDAHFEEAR